MYFLLLLEFVVWTLLVVFVVTQVIFPLFEKRPLFPLFRKRRVELESEIVELGEQIREEKLADEAEVLRERLEALRTTPETLDKSKQ